MLWIETRTGTKSKKAYDAMVYGIGNHASSAIETIEKSYAEKVK